MELIWCLLGYVAYSVHLCVKILILQAARYPVLGTGLSEGINFIAVRRMILTDVPSSPTQLVQQVGRALRLYSHKGLPDKEQTVTSTVYVY